VLAGWSKARFQLRSFSVGQRLGKPASSESEVQLGKRESPDAPTGFPFAQWVKREPNNGGKNP